MKNKTFHLNQKIYIPFKGEIPFEQGERVLLDDTYYCEFQGATDDGYLVMLIVGVINFEGALV